MNKRKYVLLFAVGLLVALGVYANASGDNGAGVSEVTVQDPVRLVAIGGAVTEIVYTLGAGDLLVGSSHTGTPVQQERKVPRVPHVRSVTAEGILALEPTHIIAGGEIGPPNSVAQLRASGISFVILPVIEGPESLYQAIDAVADVLNLHSESVALKKSIQETFSKVQPIASAPSVLYLMKSPNSMQLLAAGTGTRAQTLIEMAGGRNAVDSFSGFKALSNEALIMLQPDVLIVATPEVFEHRGTAEDAIANLKKHPLWPNLKAAQTHQIYTVGLGQTLAFGPSLADVTLQMNGFFRAAAAE